MGLAETNELFVQHRKKVWWNKTVIEETFLVGNCKNIRNIFVRNEAVLIMKVFILSVSILSYKYKFHSFKLIYIYIYNIYIRL